MNKSPRVTLIIQLKLENDRVRTQDKRVTWNQIVSRLILEIKLNGQYEIRKRSYGHLQIIEIKLDPEIYYS